VTRDQVEAALTKAASAVEDARRWYRVRNDVQAAEAIEEAEAALRQTYCGHGYIACPDCTK
jgi:hypothetical protein